VTKLDDFIPATLTRQVDAEEAIHNGDPAPRLKMWSRMNAALNTRAIDRREHASPL
jgi:hypothetical protein